MAAHGLDNNIQALKRWAVVSQQVLGSDTPMPADYQSWAQANPTAATAISDADSQLHQLLSNQAPSALKLAALTGEWSDVAPTAEERAESARAERIEQLLADGNPFGAPGRYEGETFIPPVQGNLTKAMLLREVDPALADRLEAEAKPAMQMPGVITEEEAARINARLQATANPQPAI